MAEGQDILAAIEANRQQNPGSADAFVEQSNDKKNLAVKVQRDIAKAGPMVSAFKAEAGMAEAFYDGNQWEEFDKMRLEQLRRPTIVFNEIKPTINAISGIERLNRADIRFISRPLDSNPVQDLAGDLASEAYATVLDLCDGDMERSRAIHDMSKGGMGWYEIRMDYTMEPDGKIMLDRLPWREMYWDKSSRKENLMDSRWRARKRDMGREEFKRRFGEDVLKKVDVGTPQYEEMNVGKYELVTPYYSIANEKANPQVGEQGPITNNIPVIQYQWLENEPIYRYADPEAPGGMQEFREKDWKKLKTRMTLLGMPQPFVVRSQRAIYRQVFVARGVVIEDPVEIPGGFSLKCITGEWDENKKCWYGVVRPLIDPQKTMNKSMSTALTMFLTNAKGGLMFETGAFADPEMAKNQWSQPDAFIEMLEGGAEKVVQRQPVNHSAPMELFFSESKAAMNYVSGIPADMMGIAVGDANAPTIGKRIQAALSVLGWYFDNITRARKDEARTVLEFIREYWTQGQFIKVGGDINAQAIPLLKSNLPMTYDLQLDDSVRHNPNLKAQVWQDIQPIIPALLKFGLGRFLLKILKFSPLPAQLVIDLQKEAQAMMQDPNAPKPGQKPGQGRGKQEDPQVVQAKVEKMNAETQKILKEAQEIDAESGYRIASMALDAMHKREIVRQKDDMNDHRHFADIVKGVHMLMGTAKNRIG